MRQYDQTLDKFIKAGLRPDDHVPDDGQFLTAALNCYPFSGVLKHAESWTETFPTINKPAQIFTPIQGIFILTDTEVYSWNGAVLQLLLNNIPAGSPWTLADFSPVLIFTNGVTNVFRDPNGNWSFGDPRLPKAYSVSCHFRGRYLGGIGKTLDWSRIGRLEFLSVSDPLALRENSAGSRDMDYAGPIYAIHSMGKACVVYAAGGITVIEPTAVHILDYQLRQSINTFKFDNLDYIGVPGTLAVKKVNEMDHRFISNDGYLYKLSSEGKKRIGYKEFIPVNPRVCFNSQDMHELVVIGGASPSLAVNDFGAGTLSFNASDVSYDKRVGLMVHTADGSAIDQSTVQWTTDILYFDRAGDKTIEQVILHAHDITVGSAYAQIAVRNDSESNWVLSEWYQLNQSLEASIGITGKMFMITIKIVGQTGPDFHYLKVGVKFTDRRFVRGLAGRQQNGNQADS